MFESRLILIKKPPLCLQLGMVWLMLAVAARAQQENRFPEARTAIVRITTSGVQIPEEGTGFIIDTTATHAVVLTNRHVVADSTPGGIWMPAPNIWVTPVGSIDTIRVIESLVRYDNRGKDDLALLYVDRKQLRPFHTLCLSRRKQSDGIKVYALTLPAEMEVPLTTTPGTITSREYPFYNISFETRGALLQGESGSPVVNEAGIVVGMVTQKIAARNQALQSVVIRNVLENYKVELPSCINEDQTIGLPEFDFVPVEEHQGSSDKFIEHAKKFLSYCPELGTSSGKELDSVLSRIEQRKPEEPVNYDRALSYIVRGNGRKQGKLFVLDFSLRFYPGEEVTESWTVRAKNLRDLADSAGVRLVRFFGYRTRFEGVPHELRTWSMRSGFVSAAPSVLLFVAAQNSRRDYEKAFTRQDAEASYSAMHRNEILRNSAIVVTGASLIGYGIAKWVYPREPVLEKVRMK